MVRSLLKRWWYLIIIAFLMTRAIDNLGQGHWLLSVSTVLAASGVAMNVVVIILNDGMPARAIPSEIPIDERDNYKPIDKSTRLAFLADWIEIRDYLVSPGDILIATGILSLAVDAVLR